jgi:hypothetical protein
MWVLICVQPHMIGEQTPATNAQNAFSPKGDYDSITGLNNFYAVD